MDRHTLIVLANVGRKLEHHDLSILLFEGMVDIFTAHFRVQNEATLPDILKSFTLPYSIPKLSG